MLLFGYDIMLMMGYIILISLEYVVILGGMYFYLVYKPKRLNLVVNPMIEKENYVTIDKHDNKEQYKNEIAEYKYNKQIDKVPEVKNRVTVIILRENKFSKILYFDASKESFNYGKSLYFIVAPHTCDNGAKLLVYLEGISLPISYENVQKETINKKYIDIDGKEKTTIITVIKGLKWDGKILHIFTNRKFAEIFTKIDEEMLPLLIFIIGTITLIVSCIGVAVTYFMTRGA